MNEIESLWNENRHINLCIPDTLLIKDKEIKDWFYSSPVFFI